MKKAGLIFLLVCLGCGFGFWQYFVKGPSPAKYQAQFEQVDFKRGVAIAEKYFAAPKKITWGPSRTVNTNSEINFFVPMSRPTGVMFIKEGFDGERRFVITCTYGQRSELNVIVHDGMTHFNESDQETALILTRNKKLAEAFKGGATIDFDSHRFQTYTTEFNGIGATVIECSQ